MVSFVAPTYHASLSASPSMRPTVSTLTLTQNSSDQLVEQPQAKPNASSAKVQVLISFLATESIACLSKFNNAIDAYYFLKRLKNYIFRLREG
jgi:hypothetical protein